MVTGELLDVLPRTAGRDAEDRLTVGGVALADVAADGPAVLGVAAALAARDGAILLCAGKDLCWPGAQSIEGFYRLRELFNQLRERRGN